MYKRYWKPEPKPNNAVIGKSTWSEDAKETIWCECPICGKTCSGEFPKHGGFFEITENCGHATDTRSGGRDTNGSVIVVFVFGR